MTDRYVPPPGHAPAKQRERVDEPVFVDVATAIVCSLALLLLVAGCVCLVLAGRPA